MPSQYNLFGSADPWADMDLYQPHDYNQSEAYSQQFRAGSVVGHNQDAYANMFDPPPQYPSMPPMSSLERLASTGNRGFLGRLGAIKLSKRKEQEAAYMRARQDWEDKQRMKYQQAQLESIDRQRREPHFYGSPQPVMRDGKPTFVTRPEDIQPTDQPYQTQKQDTSFSLDEMWYKAFVARNKREPTDQEVEAHKARIARESRAPQQPPQPSWSMTEVEDEEGNVTMFPWDRTSKTPPKLPPGLRPHKTGTEKPKDTRADVAKAVAAFEKSMRLKEPDMDEAELRKMVQDYRASISVEYGDDASPDLPTAQPGTVWKKNKKTGEIGLFDERTGARIQ